MIEVIKDKVYSFESLNDFFKWLMKEKDIL